jgi:NADPH-dependent 2,4-dienoyl-CoA reductase/sulfur reductase-like enzyme/nitrite reductase/ring-hydroxylating ferredoxin subunit
MGGQSGQLSGPDFGAGVPITELEDGAPRLGHAAGEPVVVVRRGDQLFAVGAACTHYGGPLAEGLVVDGTIRCPWHHACFDLATGRAVGAPALNPIPCYEVVVEGGIARIGAVRPVPPIPAPPVSPSSVVIIGAGPAGAVCAETLREEGYRGPITLIGDDGADPVDRPNLSKDYLAGNAPPEWIPLRDADFYRQREIELIRGTGVAGIDLTGRTVRLADAREIRFGALLLATGSEPIRLPIQGADLPQVHTLRTLADSQAIIARATTARTAVVIGASFIGLEVAASLRQRGLEVAVVAPETVPLEKVLGPALGELVRRIHEGRGVQFHLGRKPTRIDPETVTLDDDTRLPAELVVMGVGVRPRTQLAEAGGLDLDRGIVVDEMLRTKTPDVYAAGDVARFPMGGALVRIEHWVVAERQGQAVARAMVGRGRPFRDVPFFWSAHYDTTISYVGHSERWDAVEVTGSLEEGDACVVYREEGVVAAVATIGRDRTSLEVERALEREDRAGLARVLARQ